MKILLINPPCRTPSVLPLGLGYIAGVLRRDGHMVSMLDLNAEKRTLGSLEIEISNADCDVIGIGGLTTTYSFIKEVSAMIRKINPELRIIVGNMVSTSYPELLLKNSEVDICVIDEGEETVRELIPRIKDFPHIEDIPGIAFKKGSDVVRTGARDRIKDLDALPFPAWDLFPMEVYINNPLHNEYGRRSMNISAVRGCPFQCIYCSRPFGSHVYKRTPESVIAEIKALIDGYKIEFIGFSDDLFIVDKRWVEHFCDLLINARLKIGWGSSARVNLIDRAMLEKMKKSGCEVLSYGFESGSQKILDAMKKGAKVKDAENAIRLTRQARIRVEGSFMIGMIGETADTVKETVDFIKRNDLGLNRFFYTTPFPGTPLYGIARSIGRIPDDEDAYVSSLGEMCKNLPVNLTDMTDAELRDLKKKAESDITENFSIRVKTDMAIEEFRRIAADIRSVFRSRGLIPAIGRSLGKIKNRISH